MTPRQPFIGRDYYGDPRRKMRTGLVRTIGRPLRRLGFDLEVRTFYSPVPITGVLPSDVWGRRTELPGIAFDPDAQLAWIERELSPHFDEFRPPSEPTGGRYEYFLGNGLYQGGDADLLYAILRRFKPRRVLELGAGFSTLVAAAAVRANRAEGHETALVSCDPYAELPPPGAVDGLAEVRPIAAEALPPEEYGRLESGDVLFIDSSHTVKVGGDVNHLLLEVVPRLAPGVLVHVHDIFLPYEYPRDWIEHNRWYWAEQYLLQALLVGNAHLEVVVGAHGLFRERGDALAQLIPNLDPAHPPLSFWMRTR